MRNFLLLSCLLVAVSCAPPPQAQPQAQSAAVSTNIVAVQAARTRAQQQPGPLSAYQLAKTVHDHARGGHYASRQWLLQEHANDAIKWLEAATSTTSQEQALLAAWSGVLQLDLGRTELAILALQNALTIAPSNLAAGALVNQYAATGEMGKLFKVCSTVAPALHDPKEIYQLTDHCMRNSRAITQEAALAWAPPAHVIWFHQETRRRQAVQAVQHQQQAAQQAAEQRRKQQEQEQQARTRSDAAIANYACSQECRETAYDCQAECGNNACEFGCSSRRDSCLRRCKK